MAFTFPDVFRRAGLRTTEAAVLLGVSRVTISAWKNENHPPHRMVAHKVARFTTAVEEAVREKELPLHADVRRGERLKRLHAILKNHLK